MSDGGNEAEWIARGRENAAAYAAAEERFLTEMEASVAKELTDEDIRNLIDKIGDMAIADATHQDVMIEIGKAVGLIDGDYRMPTHADAKPEGEPWKV